jgi:hypothetical protein
MPYSISTLLIRNLDEVFGENDPVRRRTAIEEIFHEPNGVYRGRDEIDRIAGAIKATHPDFRYQPLAPPEELGNVGRVQWVSGAPRRGARLRRDRFHRRPRRPHRRPLSLLRQASLNGLPPPRHDLLGVTTSFHTNSPVIGSAKCPIGATASALDLPGDGGRPDRRSSCRAVSASRRSDG